MPKFEHEIIQELCLNDWRFQHCMGLTRAQFDASLTQISAKIYQQKYTKVFRLICVAPWL